MDLSVFQFFNSLAGRSDLFDAVIVFIAQILPFFIGIGLLLFVWRFPGGLREKLHVASGLIMATVIGRGILVETIRFFYLRPRPFFTENITPLFTSHNYSFPSGHATLLFAVSFFIFYYNRSFGWSLLALSLLNGLGRVVAGVHWPSDILGGVLVGAASCGLTILLLKPHRPKKRESLPKKSDDKTPTTENNDQAKTR